MYLDDYYSDTGGWVLFSREQASAFAKGVADDFNPLHDPENKLFCVPGDLLFSVAVRKLGLYQRMRFEFAGMVDGSQRLRFADAGDGVVRMVDESDRAYLNIHREGERTSDPGLIGTLTRRYVEFSGHTFPDILMPLMAEQAVMINPARPLVIYESMEIDLPSLDFDAPTLAFTGSTLDVNGKRGSVRLGFQFRSAGEAVGGGAKFMSLRGLRTYDPAAAEAMIRKYRERKGSPPTPRS